VNDPDRRRWSEGFDDDAIFADIVAHLNDDEAQEQAAADPGVQDEAAPLQTTDMTESAAQDNAADYTAEPTPRPADRLPGESTQEGPSQWYINPPPWLPLRKDPEGDQETSPQTDPSPEPWRAPQVDRDDQGDQDDQDDQEHFEPLPVSPLPAGDLQFWAIIVGMCGGPLLLLYLVLFNRDASSYWILIAIAMSVGGFALLVSRMPGHHGDDDDGARL
jgi:hypothetical protein